MLSFYANTVATTSLFDRKTEKQHTKNNNKKTPVWNSRHEDWASRWLRPGCCFSSAWSECFAGCRILYKQMSAIKNILLWLVTFYKFILNLQLDVGKVVEVILVALKASLQRGVGALVAGVVHRVQLRMISWRGLITWSRSSKRSLEFTCRWWPGVCW